MVTVPPNPTSPYATADARYRHLHPTPILLPPPSPGVLAATACREYAVVPEDATPIEDLVVGVPLGGLCPTCLAVILQGIEPAPSPLATCTSCGDSTLGGALCALCRVEAHDRWRTA